MIRRQTSLLISLSAVALAAMATEPFPGLAPDRHIMDVQLKVDSLFENGDYERAMIIYRNELAPLGDKYAQYMIGYMYLAGKGVARNLPTAAAWYRLAAERGQETFVRESDKLTALLSAADRHQADSIFVDLRARLGDAALINRLIEEDLSALQASGPDTASAFRGADPVDRRQRQSRQQRETQLVARIQYGRSMLTTDDWAGAESRQRFRELERRAQIILAGPR